MRSTILWSARIFILPTMFSIYLHIIYNILYKRYFPISIKIMFDIKYFSLAVGWMGKVIVYMVTTDGKILRIWFHSDITGAQVVVFKFLMTSINQKGNIIITKWYHVTDCTVALPCVLSKNYNKYLLKKYARTIHCSVFHAE